nr:MAG TPA: response regulator [Caudoviricetes sp.]
MNILKFKNIELNLDIIECKIDDKIVNLTKNEFLLLEFFIQPNNLNKVFNRKELIKSIWKNEVSNRTVDTTISRLRKKLGSSEKYLITKLGFGYGFINK